MNPSSWFSAGGVSSLQVLWEDGERVFCRGERQADGYRAAVLAVLPAAEHPTPATLDRLAREYELKNELDGPWAVRPLELIRDRGRIMLVLEDTRSEPLDRLLGVPMEAIAGTLAYMAPEQTGRMNRSIDARSDLYALGVTFYQMLTGLLPFTAAGPMEWIHCHIARKPVPPSERLETVPAAVSALILKLLAKTAEERYQTAAGLERDLRRCLAAG